MDLDWTAYFSGWWIFALLCLIFMAIMMFGRRCMPFRGGRQARSGDGGATARQILDRRYARGEIGKEQYVAIRRDLNG
jgi:putative membrane protein